MRKRKFVRNSPNHVYQRFRDDSMIFYSLEDCLVYFTLFCVEARVHHIRVLGLCLMFDHLHQLVQTPIKENLSDFEKELTVAYSFEYLSDLYSDCGDRPSKGGLFKVPYGSAPKVGSKNVRTSIAYLYNNPVEKKLSGKAEEWKWNFLAYSASDHPFSDKLTVKNASAGLRRSIKEVNWCLSQGFHLRHAQLRRLFAPLEEKECNQLRDYIISKYNVIDYDYLMSYYGNYETALLAFDSNTGSERELNEEWHPNPDIAYAQMIKYVTNQKIVVKAKDVRLLPEEKRSRLKSELLRATSADDLQASRFLGLEG